MYGVIDRMRSNSKQIKRLIIIKKRTIVTIVSKRRGACQKQTVRQNIRLNLCGACVYVRNLVILYVHNYRLLYLKRIINLPSIYEFQDMKSRNAIFLISHIFHVKQAAQAINILKTNFYH